MADGAVVGWVLVWIGVASWRTITDTDGFRASECPSTTSPRRARAQEGETNCKQKNTGADKENMAPIQHKKWGNVVGDRSSPRFAH